MNQKHKEISSDPFASDLERQEALEKLIDTLKKKDFQWQDREGKEAKRAGYTRYGGLAHLTINLIA